MVSIGIIVVIRDNRILRVIRILFVHPNTDGRHARQQTFYRQTVVMDDDENHHHDPDSNQITVTLFDGNHHSLLRYDRQGITPRRYIERQHGAVEIVARVEAVLRYGPVIEALYYGRAHGGSDAATYISDGAKAEEEMREWQRLRQIDVRGRAYHHFRNAQGKQRDEKCLAVGVATYQKIHRSLVKGKQNQRDHEVFLESPVPFDKGGEGQQRTYEDSVQDRPVERYGIERIILQYRGEVDGLQQLGCRLQNAHPEQKQHEVLYRPKAEYRQRQVGLVVEPGAAECGGKQGQGYAGGGPDGAAAPPVVVLTVGEEPDSRDEERAPQEKAHEVDPFQRKERTGTVVGFHQEIDDAAMNHQQRDDKHVHQPPVAVVGQIRRGQTREISASAYHEIDNGKEYGIVTRRCHTEAEDTGTTEHTQHLEEAGHEAHTPDDPGLLSRHSDGVADNQPDTGHEKQLPGVHIELQPVHHREAHRYAAKRTVVGHLDVFAQQGYLADNLVGV